MKRCSHCKEHKPREEFNKNKSARDGLAGLCKICHRKDSMARIKANPERHKVYYQRWFARNKDYYKNYKENVRKLDPKWKIRERASALLRMKLRRRLVGKTKSSYELFPFTLEELIQHLEAQFKPGMTWENYGTWHIDHIVPDIAFNYTSTEDEEFRKCWALSNLQPLWAAENQSKASRDRKLYKKEIKQ